MRYLLATTFMAIIVCACTLVFAQETTPPENNSSAPAKSPNAEKIHELMVQKRDTLNDYYKVVYAKYLAGQVAIVKVYDAESNLMSAKLDLAESDDERLELHKARVKLLKEQESKLYAYTQSGQVPAGEHLQGKSRRIAAEIELLREEDRQR
ncbi:hypothetical protein Pan97_45910 [Bremerella volcania]|uniref:Outer membrane efflux protein n=1 Tax=Bremerella volcania TaxID=2527984 RepID=A0A518CE67_9BACT|nr:hypothetical protein [Bremerella volcania]QDU77520.1 hypothetical protein Pan97_45910 [Bremerella volcania]